MARPFTAFNTIMAKLFYVMGASGAGKDSLLSYARSHLHQHRSLIFAHRYITRKATAGGENHIELSEEEFHSRHHMGLFSMHWYSHHQWYALGIEIKHWLSMGLSVVVNGSRAYLDQAIADYPLLLPILITADQEILRDRLIKRNREPSEAIEQRLTRTKAIASPMSNPRIVEIPNNGELSAAGEQLVKLLSGEPDI
jgi:ribose 1,5-bisphosphokinase